MQMRVRADELQPEDELVNGLCLERVYNDIDGVWVEWSDGDCGYMDHDRVLTIYRG